jgi:hypothetical protein
MTEETLPSDTTLPVEGDDVKETHPVATYIEGFKAGRLQGQSEERARIQSIEALNARGYEDLVEPLKWDGVTTAPEAAVRLLAAQKAQLDYLDKALREDAPLPLPPIIDDYRY